VKRVVVAAIALLTFAPAAPILANGVATASLVTVGSPTGTTPQNHQNEPAVAMDAHAPNVLAAGVNDFLDWQPCPEASALNNGDCRGSNAGVGLSGVYFSFDSGLTWTQPTYTGLTSRDCTNNAPCTPHVGSIGTLPWYYENGLASSGDPAVAFGPKPDGDGAFSWDNGSRLYYANLTGVIGAGFPQVKPFRGFLGIGVSRIDDVSPSAVADKDSWMAPVIATTRSSATAFEDKEQLWADNAASSPYFGNVYVCVDEYRSNSRGQALAQTVNVATSSDGGDTWRTKQARAANTTAATGFHGACSIRTDSNGVVYLFYTHFAVGLPGNGAHTMQKSFDGGHTWSRPRDVLPANDGCFNVDPVYFRCVLDGGAGARIDLFASPSIDIANGAPTGDDATDEIVDAWNTGVDGLNNEKTVFSWSVNGGRTWSAPATVSLAGDRPLYAAPAISPDGATVYVIYEAVTSPWRAGDMTSARPYHGVFRSATIGGSGAPGGWLTLYNGPFGDIRASYPGHDIYQERVGDYVYAAASRDYGVGLWADTADADVCTAVQTYRADSYAAGSRQLPAPWPTTECPAKWGNVQIKSATTGP
jgi:hypothetical protein